MRSEPRWLEAAYVVQLNASAVEDTGEPHLLRDAGLLDSACHVPRNRWAYDGEDDIGVLAAMLFLAISRNHAFEQGNKRAAFAAMQAFLFLNENRLVVPDTVAVADLMKAVISREQDDELFVELLAECVVEARG